MNPLRKLFVMLSRIPPAVSLVVIVSLAGIVALLVSNSVETAKRGYEEQAKSIKNANDAKGKMLFTNKSIPEGTPISADMLEEREVLQNSIPVGAVTNEAMAIGRVAKYTIGEAQPLTQQDLAPVGVALGFESRLKVGQRAVTFAVDSNSGVAGFVTPESRVDVMSMVGSGAQTRVEPILSDVEVIAVGQVYEKTPGKADAIPVGSVTVAVSPDDAKSLVKAVASSKLYLALRNSNDHTPLVTVDVTSLFPAAPGSEERLREIASVPPPPLTMPPEPPSIPDLGDPTADKTGEIPAGVIPQAPREIEMWSGNSRAVVAVPTGN